MDITPPSDSTGQPAVDDNGMLIQQPGGYASMPAPQFTEPDQELSQIEDAVMEAAGPGATPPPFDQVMQPHDYTPAPQAVIEPPIVEAPAITPPAQTEPPIVEAPQIEQQEELSTQDEPEDRINVKTTPRHVGDQPKDEEPSDLEDVKNQALHALAPIANKLDIPADERFKTMMQLIQATDNHELTKAALEAAQSIESDSERAQALLDVVNEIEYLEQQKKEASSENED